MLSFKATKKDTALIGKCATRAVKLAKEAKIEYDQTDAVMDLNACHSNGCPLNFVKLLGFNKANFGHDVFGIRRFINHQSGTLGGGFLPRCSKPAKG